MNLPGRIPPGPGRRTDCELAGVVVLGALAACGCVAGPRYVRPDAPVPPSYHEQSGAETRSAGQSLPGEWWRLFGYPQLADLEKQIRVSNQNLKASEAQFRQARAMVRFYRAGMYPTAMAGATAAPQHSSDNRPPHSALSGATFTDLQLPGDVAYEVDAWGRVRRTLESARENAEASAADLAAVNLSLQTELATDYFELRSADAQRKLLADTVADYERALQLTENRYRGGLASNVDVEQARTQLEATRAQELDVSVQRSQFEHAIAVLVGKPASAFSLNFSPVAGPPPTIPVGIPSQLLERRPDIAAAERRVAAANAQIGIARAALFPSITLSAASGFESGTLGTLVQGPALFWSLGAGAAETVFDAGRRRATIDQAQAAHDQTVAAYRQTVLAAFQEVEDNLAALRILDHEASTQNAAVQAARRALSLSETRYKGGVVNYLEVLTAQSAALADERAAVDIMRRRLDSSVLLVKALGGGWDAAAGIPQAESMATAGSNACH